MRKNEIEENTDTIDNSKQPLITRKQSIYMKTF